MPYLNRRIPSEGHKPYCRKPKVIRWLTRGYNKQGNRTLIPVALKCLNCGVIVEEPNNNPTMSIPALPKIHSEKESLSIEEIEHRLTNNRIRTKEVQPVLNRQEKKYNSKVRQLNGIYKKDQKVCPRLKGKLNRWDPKALERFLDSRPSFYQVRKLMLWPPLYRDSREYANRRRGWVPDYENFGHIKYDYGCYNILWYKWNRENPGIINLNELSEWEKLVIEECNARMEFMESVTKKNLESKIKIYHPVQEQDKIKKQAKIYLNAVSFYSSLPSVPL